MYNIQFSTKYILDVSLVMEYISSILFNPQAAIKLRKEIDKKIESIKMFPDGFPIFDTENKTQYTYHKVRVKNYYIFYYIDDNSKTIVLSRFVYCKMNLNDIDMF